MTARLDDAAIRIMMASRKDTGAFEPSVQDLKDMVLKLGSEALARNLGRGELAVYGLSAAYQFTGEPPLATAADEANSCYAAIKRLRIRAEAAEAEVERLKAEQAAAVCAWEEYARWPDLPSVPIGRVRLPDGREEEIALRPEQITGILRGIEKHVRQCLPYGVEAVKAWQDIGSVIAQRDAARAEVARLTRERDEARAASDKWQDRACDGWALQPGCHTGPGECPTYHDGCHCTRDVLIHNIARAESAEAEVARLRAAALPEDAEERAAEVMWARAVTRLGDASLPWASMSDDGHVKRFWREEARAVLAALRGDA